MRPKPWSRPYILRPQRPAWRSCRPGATPSTQPWPSPSPWRWCYPQAGNLGGAVSCSSGGPDGEVHFLDYREKAPARATANMYLDSQGNVIPGMSTPGYKAIAVPGSVAGLAYAQQHWGKLSLKQVMEPAIRLARDGYELTYGEARSLHDRTWRNFPSRDAYSSATATTTNRERSSSSPNWRRPWSASRENPDDFYHGAMARELAAAIQKGGGLVTAEDLAQYQVKERQPIRGTYRGYEIISRPAALVRRRDAHRGPQHPGRVRPWEAGPRLGRSHAPDGRSLPARVLRSRRIPGRSGFLQDPCRATDR